MSTQPIGTLFPSVAPNALIRVGVPSANGFSMTDGVVSVESLIPASGTWTPEISDVTYAAEVSAVAGFYTNVNGVVSGWIKATLELTDEIVTLTSFKFSLPVLPTDNFADSDKLIGVISVGKITLASTASAASTTGAKTATVNFDGTETGQTNILSISFSYQV